MTALAIRVGSCEVAAAVETDVGTVLASASVPVAADEPQPGWAELSPDALWQAALVAGRLVLDAVSGPPELVRVRADITALLLWDRETLGSPRPGITGADRRTAELCTRLDGQEVRRLAGRPLEPGAVAASLAWLREADPHTWALLEEDRYAVGGPASYLVARMTRGTWHVASEPDAAATLLLDPATGRWSPELCALFGVPAHALPDVVHAGEPVARTDARSFLGLDVPVALG